MRIVTWNCNRASAHKVRAIAKAYEPDFLVMPESAKTPPEADLFSAGDEIGHGWTRAFREGPESDDQGLGIFSFRHGEITQIDDSEIEETSGSALAVRATKFPLPLTILGIWTLPSQVGIRRSKYINALEGIVDRWSSLLERGDVIVAGDFNAPTGTSSDLHEFSEFASTLENRFNLTSAYHQFTGEPFGGETRPTFWHRYNHGSSFHIDYIFVPRDRPVTRVEVGTYEDWTAKGQPARSDHAPVIVDVEW